MKNKFVKTTLTLSLLLLTAAPTQAFAGTNCGGNVSVPLNQQTVVKDLNSCVVNNSWIKQNCSNLESLCKTNAANAKVTKGKNCQKIVIKNLSNQKCTAGKVTTVAPSNSTTQNADQTSKANTATTTTEKATANTTEKATANTAEKATANTAEKATANTAEKATANTETTTTANTAAIGSYEQQVANIVNKERAAAGLKALTLDTSLSKVAEAKAQDMSDKNYFSHTSPTYGSPFDMMKQFGIQYSSAGENIAMGQQTPESVMTAWMNSSGHKANILGTGYGKIGVGYVKNSNGTTYWVQEFTN